MLPERIQRLAAFPFPHEHRIAGLKIQNDRDVLILPAYVGFINDYVFQTLDTYGRILFLQIVHKDQMDGVPIDAHGLKRLFQWALPRAS
jgi:hypothetical protein